MFSEQDASWVRECNSSSGRLNNNSPVVVGSVKEERRLGSPSIPVETRVMGYITNTKMRKLRTSETPKRLRGSWM